MKKWLYILMLFIYFEVFTHLFACGCSLAQSCLTLQRARPPLQQPIDYSTPGLPVPRGSYFPKFAQVHAHCASCGMGMKSPKESEVTQLCPTLCDPMDCSPPGSSIHGILQARILEWVAISFSRGSS